MKILYKILLPVLLATASGLFIATIYTYNTSMETLRETNTARQKMAIANALVELKAGLDFNILNAISLAQTGILQPYLSDNLQKREEFAYDANSRIINMRNTYYYVMLGIIDDNGIVLDHTEKEFIGKDFTNVSFFKEAMQGKVAIGTPYKYKDMVVYNVASPVYDIDTNEITGVVFNVSKLTDTMSGRMHLGHAGYLYVVDQEGTVFIHNNDEYVLDLNLGKYDWGKEILEKGEGNMIYTFEGTQRLAYYDTLPEANWIAVAIIDVNELEAPGNNIRNNSFKIAIITLFLITIIIFFYVKNIVDALLKAVRYAEQVSKGVLDEDLDFGMAEKSLFTKLKLKISKLFNSGNKDEQTKKLYGINQFNRKDEIGILYNALAEMVNSMRDMVKKADDANKMKSDFLSNMSHEIRTPLNAVIGLTYLCLEDNQDEDKKLDYIKKIQTAGKSLLGIINNVLDTSKIEAGMFELEEVHFSLYEICSNVMSIYNDSAKNKDLNLKFHYDEQLNKHFIGDPVRIGQILNNLVGNAIKFTESGEVCVSCKLGTNKNMASIEKEENIVPICIEVSDSGIGFCEEQGKLLFKQFSQADSSISRKFGGTGLGLTISKQIAELMNGSIYAKSEVGVGSTFTIEIYLKIDEDYKEDTIATEKQEFKFEGKHILVAEDNLINQLLMKELLKSTEAEISIAGNGQIAVDMVKEKHFDIILMDMQMPVMDGIQAMKIIRNSYSKETLPIIAVTANAMKEDREKGIALGLNDYLTKPIDPHSLMMSLKTWLT